MADLAEPTPERRRRSTWLEGPAVATEHGPARAGTRLHRALSTLERLAKNGILEPRQAEAGERLRTDYELGLLGVREPASGSVSSTGWYYAEARLAAIRRAEKAIAALGPTWPVVLAVAVHDHPISGIARFLQQNRQEVAGMLKCGLSALAEHYGIDCDRSKISHNMLTSRNNRGKYPSNRP